GVAFRWLADRRSRIVDENIETAEPFGGLIDHRPAGVFIGYIERNEHALAPELRHGRCGFSGVARRHSDTGSGSGEPSRHAEPDPAIASGDDGDTSRQIEHGHQTSPTRARRSAPHDGAPQGALEAASARRAGSTRRAIGAALAGEASLGAARARLDRRLYA